jgi:hypothetical protein
LLSWITLALAQAVSCTPFPQAGSPAWQECFEKILHDAENRPTVGDILARGLRSLRGRSQTVAFSKLGYPDKKMIVAGSVVYSWINNDTNRDGSALVCTVKVIVRRNVVVDSDFHGNNGACEHYARRFDPSFKL